MTDFYCGVNNPPRGKVRGTPEQCLGAKQVRYYGVEKINPRLLKKEDGPDLTKERLKLKNLEDKGKKILRETTNLKIIIDDPTERASKIRKASKRLKVLNEQRVKLIKKLKNQKAIIDSIVSIEESKPLFKRKNIPPGRRISLTKLQDRILRMLDYYKVKMRDTKELLNKRDITKKEKDGIRRNFNNFSEQIAGFILDDIDLLKEERKKQKNYDGIKIKKLQDMVYVISEPI